MEPMMINRWNATLVASLSLLLASCGSDAQPVPGSAADCSPGSVDGDLSLYNWTDYIDPGLVTSFEDEYGVRVREDYYGSNEEMLVKVTAGGTGYDIVVPSDYMVSIMREEGLLLELDHRLLTNLGNISEGFADPAYDPGLRFSVPYLWGTTGLGINAALLGEVEPSWDLVFDPDVAGSLPGRVALLDDPRETLGAALHWLGYSPNTTDITELEEAAAVISRARAWTVTFESILYGDLLLSGEVVVAHGYSGNLLEAFGDDDRFAYLVPREGATIYAENLSILATAPHPCTAHTFIDFILRPENHAALTNYIYYPAPNSAAIPFIDAELLTNPAVYPPADVLDRLLFLEDTGEFEPEYANAFLRATS
jgi:spermidine/putrescine transport system substrate-binding protein